jgi:hypothetical protein
MNRRDEEDRKEDMQREKYLGQFALFTRHITRRSR